MWNVVSMLFQCCAMLFWRCFNVGVRRCATLKNRRRILFHFQSRINVISMLIHNVETTLIRHWNVGWAFLKKSYIIDVWQGLNLPPFPDNIYLFIVTNRSTRRRCEICSTFTIETPTRRKWHRSVVFIVKFEHIPHHFIDSLLLTLNK